MQGFEKEGATTLIVQEKKKRGSVRSYEEEIQGWPRIRTELISPGTSLVAQMVKHRPAMRETWVRSLGQEDPLEKEMAIHSSTLAWKIPWTEDPDRVQSMGSQRVGHD